MSDLIVDVWADLQCPWCYIAKGRLRAAIAAYESPATVQVNHRAYLLDPGMPPGTQEPVVAYLGQKYGGGQEGGLAMTERVTQAAARDGLVLDFAHAVKTSTVDGHRLVKLAAELGGWELAQAALERFYAAHFQEGLALDDHEVLLRLAAEAGLDERRVATVLASDEFADQVEADRQAARDLGVTGVPFSVAAGRVGVGGAQPVEVFGQLLHQGAEAALRPEGGCCGGDCCGG